MSLDSNIMANSNVASATANGVASKPSGSSSGTTKKTKKSRARPKPKEPVETENYAAEKKGKSETKRSKDTPSRKDSTHPKDRSESVADAGSQRPSSKAKSKANTTTAKDPKRATKERNLVESYDAKFLRKPLLDYGNPACSLAIHHLPPNLDKTGFLLQASELSPTSTKHIKIFYQQGTQPADLLDLTIHSVANFEFPSASHASAVKIELDKQSFMDSDSETKYVCQVIKPIIGGVADVSYGEQDDPAGAINTPIFRQFSRLREKGEPVNLSQMFATVVEKKTTTSVQDPRKVSETKKEEKPKRRTKKKAESKASVEKKTSKLQKPINRSADSESGDKTPETKQKRLRRRKNVSDKKPANGHSTETTRNTSYHSEEFSAA